MDGDFQNHTGIEWTGHTGVVKYGPGDQRMVVLFYNKSVHNPAKSVAEGRPYYEDQVYVRIHEPGERLNIVDRPASDSDKKRFPIHWSAFQQNKQQTMPGTPIDLLYPEHPSIASTLRANGIQTIEQCAELSANAIDNIGMGGQQWVNEAVKYMASANKGVTNAQMRHETERLERDNKVLQRQVEELKQTVNHLQKTASGGPDIAAIQGLIAQAMARPQFLPNTGFDPQQAMINANNPSHRADPPSKRQRRKVSE